MANDDIERLLREIDAMNAGGAGPAQSGQTRPAPVARRDSAVAKPDADGAGGRAGGRLGFAVVAGAVMAPVGWVAGLMLPFTGAVSSGVGAAIGGFVVALVAGPPRWMSR